MTCLKKVRLNIYRRTPQQQQTIYPMPLCSFCAAVSFFYGKKTREKPSLQGMCYLACCSVGRRWEYPPGRTFFEKMFVEVRVWFFFQLWGRHSLCNMRQKITMCLPRASRSSDERSSAGRLLWDHHSATTYAARGEMQVLAVQFGHIKNVLVRSMLCNCQDTI